MKCKECEYNNNGWCKKFKAQKPKALLECESEADKEDKSESYIVNGKMQMLSMIVRQIDACEECVTSEFKTTLKTILTILENDIKIHGIALDYEVDKAMLSDLRYRINNWN